MDVDFDASTPAPPELLPTMRPRMVDDDQSSDCSHDSDDPPLLFCDDGDEDRREPTLNPEPELDDDLLEQVQLSACELLEGEFEGEELRRGNSTSSCRAGKF